MVSVSSSLPSCRDAPPRSLSSMAGENEKAVITQLLENYKEYTCLWDATDPAYLNKDMRNDAYATLLPLYRLTRPEATLKDLKKKLDNMRTTYKKEAKKVKDSLDAGDEYVPTLWYFELMTFLDGKPWIHDRSNAKHDLHDLEDEVEILNDPESNEGSSHHHFAHKGVQPDPPLIQCMTPQSLDPLGPPIVKKPLMDSDWDTIGKSIGVQLKRLSTDQQIIAQKLISDTIFYGNLNKLTTSSYVEVSGVGSSPSHGPPVVYGYANAQRSKSSPLTCRSPFVETTNSYDTPH